MKLTKSSLVFSVILLALSFVSVLPLFHAGFFTMHDDTQVARVFEMFQSLRLGMIPVRWVLDLGYGYGYPIFTFYAPLAYYVGAFSMFLGFDALIATKVMMLLGMILAGFFMYLFAREIWGEEGGFLSGILYLFAPYHALNLYVRGAVAELWGMAFLPLLFYGVWKTYKTQKWRYVVIGSLAYAGIILSHNLTAMMVSPFVGVMLLGMIVVCIRKKQAKQIVPLIVLFSFGILLSSFYWLPAVGEMGYTNVKSQISGTGSKYADHFVCLPQLWDSPWGYAGSAPGCLDGMSFRIGKLHVLLTLIAFVLGWFIYKKQKEKGVLILGAGLSFLIACFLTLPQSKSIWDSISPMSFFQFPWRFLLIIAFMSSFLSGSIIWYIQQFSKKTLFGAVIACILTIGALLLYGKLFMPQSYTSVTSASLIDQKMIRYTTSKISDEYMPRGFITPKTEEGVVTSKVKILEGQGKITTDSVFPQKQLFRTQAVTAISVLLNTAPFPAWETRLDGKTIVHENTSTGIRVSVPAGNHVLALYYQSTKLEMTGNLVSLTSMLMLFVGIIYLHKKKML